MPEHEALTAELQDILDRANAGDQKAWDELVSRAFARLLKLTRKMFRTYPRLQRWEQTDDVFQQAAFKLHRSLTEVHPESVREFFGLAAIQIRRTLIDLPRHHYGPEGSAAHHHSDGGPAAASPVVNRPESESGEPESLAQWTRFHEVVETLPETEREVLMLTWYSGMRQSEIARLLDVSTPTVRRHWQRAKFLVYERMQGESPASEHD